MAAAAEHAFNTPFFPRLVLVTAELFAAYGAMDDLLFSKDVQAKSLHTSSHTKMYVLLQGYGNKSYFLYIQYT